MTARLTTAPEAQIILDDRATGTFSSTNGSTSDLPPVTEWAARVHGAVYVHPWVFGTSRGDEPKTYPGNRDTVAKEHGSSLVRVRADDYSDVDYVRFPIAGVAGQWWGNFDTVSFTNGKLYIWGHTQSTSVTDVDGNRSALIEVDPTTLAWTVRYRTTAWLLGNGGTADSTHYYVSSSSRTNPSNNRWHGIVKVDLTTFTAVSQGYWIQSNGGFGTGPANEVTYFQNMHFHSLVEDGLYLYGTMPGEEINNLPSFTCKIRKSDLVMMWATPCPQATDDMAQSATHVFGGVETTWSALNYYPRIGKTVGAFAVRKSDGNYTELPKLGPEDVWTGDVNTNVVSFSSLVRGGYLVDIKFPINRLYVIDISNPDSWSLSSDVSEIVLADCQLDMAAVEALRRYYFSDQEWNIIAENETGPNEFVVDAAGKLHSFCWAYPFPSVIGGSLTSHEGVSSLIRYEIPGYSFSDPPSVTTLAATDVDVETRTLVVNGDITSYGGDLVTDAGFYYGFTNPPTTKVSVTPAVGPFAIDVGPLSTAGMFYYRAFAENSVGESLGDVESVDLSAIVPTVSTTAAIPASGSATLHGSVSATGGADVIGRGFRVSKVNPPITAYPAITAGLGPYSVSVEALSIGDWYAQAYATNSAGTALGAVIPFTIVETEEMAVTDVVLNLGATLTFPDGLKSPWDNHLIVDKSGNGNHTTITAALAEAAANVPATGNRWLVDVLPGVYSETITIPTYVDLRLPHGTLCTVTGGFDTPDGMGGYTTTPTITMHGRASLEGGNIQTTGLVCIRMVCDELGVTPSITGSYIQTQANTDGIATCVEIDGPTFSGAYADVMHCPVIYARNAHAGANAKAVVFRLMPGGAALRAHGSHYKISSGPGGAAERFLALNQGDNAYAQMDVSGDLIVYNGGDVYLLYNENALAQHGGRINCPVSGWVDEYTGPGDYTIPRGIIYDTRPAAGTSNLYRHYAQSVSTSELVVSGGTMAPLPKNKTGSYMSSRFQSTTTTLAIALNTARTIPFRPEYDVSVDQVRVEVTTAAAGALGRIALFSDDSTGAPGTLLVNCGTVSAATTGDKDIACVYTLKAGMLYHVYVGMEVATATWRVAVGHAPWLSQSSTLNAIGHVVSHTAGVVPTTFTPSGTTTGPVAAKFRVV